MLKLIALSAATASLISAPPAQSETVLRSQANTLITNFSWTIYDANPTDGVVPSYSFLDETNALRSLTTLGFYKPTDGSDIASDSHLSWSPSDNLIPAEGTTSLVLSGGAGKSRILETGEILSRGQLFDADIGFSGSAGVSTTATGDFSPTFYNLILGPGTGVRVMAYGKAEAWLTGGLGSFALSEAQLFASFSPPSVNGEYDPATAKTAIDFVQSYLDSESPEVIANYGHLTYSTSEGSLYVSFENLTGQSMIGRIRGLSTSYGETLAAVPELNASAMMLVGVAALSLWTSRRRKASDAVRIVA